MGIVLPQLAPASEDRASGAQVIDGSLKIDSSKSNYLNRTPSSSGNRKTWTWSGWVKKSNVSTTQNLFSANGGGFAFSGIRFSNNDQLAIFDYNSSSFVYYLLTTQVFRDPNAWYHIVVAFDSTQATSSDRLKVYINGDLITDYSTETYPSLNLDSYINNTNGHTLGCSNSNGYAEGLDGSMSQVYFIDGQALGPEYFGFTDGLTNTWRPKKYTGSFSTLANQTETWSTKTEVIYTEGSNYNPANVYDANISNYQQLTGTYGTMTLTHNFGTSITDLKIDWYFQSSNTVIRFNGDSNTDINPSSSTMTRHLDTISTPASVTSISFIADGAADIWIYGIYVNGELLIDNGLTVDSNGFYLPMDGNSPIGQDQSGKGNNWTPVNFGGSTDITKATGALPILNTGNGGTAGRPGVFGSEVSANYTTTSNTAAGSGYEFDQASGFNPSLSFVRGATYTFDYTDSSSHPLRFSSTDPDSSVTSYTDGTNTSVSNTVKITVPHNAPDTLYYYCTSHNSMNGRISVTTDESKADLYASSCIFAAPFIGNSLDVSDQINATSAQKSNSSSDVGVTYNTTATSTNFYNSYGVYAPGGGTSQKVVYSDSEDFNLDGPFTIEFFIKMNSDTDCTIICDDGINGDPQVKYTTINDRIQLQSSDVNIELDESSNTALLLSDGNWHHVAFTRSAVNDTNAIYLFIDGVEQVLRARTNDAGSSVNFNQMALFTGAVGRFPGYLQDLRIYKGVAKYTSNFIPASTNPDILPDSPSGVATKTKLTKITDGAVGFGTNGYMTTTSSDYNPGTGDFAIEGYFRFPDNSGARRAFVNDTGTFGSNSMVIRQYNTGFEFYCGGQSFSDSGYNMAQWNHAMITRSGSTVRYFVNGELRATDTTSNSISADPTNQMTIGGFYDVATPAEFMQGHASNLRLTVGSIPTDYQTSSTSAGTRVFTPSFEPLTSTSQGATSSDVKLLCCQSPTSATDAAVAPGSITANGDAAATTFNPFNTDINTVRGQEGSYCTWNPLAKTGGTLSKGNLKFVGNSNWQAVKGTFSVSSGKWYYEATTFGNTYGTDKGNVSFGIGWYKTKENVSTNDVDTASHYVNLVAFSNNGWWNNFGAMQSSVTSTTAGDVIGVALDKDNNTFEFFKNGTSVVSGSLGNTTDDLSPWNNCYYADSFYESNFGQKPFKFSPPDGFQPLTSSTVRPDTVIARPDQYVGIVTYTSTTDGQTITGYNFKPDFVYSKARSGTYMWGVHDSVRGATKVLTTNGTGGENDDTVGLLSFIDGGYVTGTDGDYGSVNYQSGNTYVAYGWKAGGNKNTFNVDDVGYDTAAGAGLNGGTITPTGASVGTKQGFSIIQWEGTNNIKTISHGLSQTPEFIINKNIDTSSNWYVGSSYLGTGNWLPYLVLNGSAGEDNNSDVWQQGGVPNATTFGVGAVGNSTGTHIAYLWHSVPGLQKFGSFEGNSNADGPFVELGFRPSIVLLKTADDTANWMLYDNERGKTNPNNFVLGPNNTDAGLTYDAYSNAYPIDFLSNGFKVRTNVTNSNSNTVIYAAWAEAPAINLYGGQSNGR